MKTLSHPSVKTLALALTLSLLTAGTVLAQENTPTNAMAMSSMGSDQTASSLPNPKVGGAAMFASKNIVENAVHSKDHTTLVAAVQAAGLVDTLESPGPFTVFAPTNEAFARLPAGTVESLLQPQNKAQLSQVLTYHVVSGRLSSRDLLTKIRADGGSATLTTVEGESLVVRQQGRGLLLTDARGNTARITIADVRQSNGVIQVIDRVLLPAEPEHPMAR